MDFVKKNWGLLAYSIMCLAIAVLFGIKMKDAASRASEHGGKVDEQLSFFDDIREAQIKLDRDNLAVAQENQELVEERYARFRRIGRFSEVRV